MPQIPSPDHSPALVVELPEWEHVGPARDPRLKGISLNDVSARRLAEALRNRIDIREGYQGLEIDSTSYVGRVDVAPVRVSMRPKLPSMPLARLLRYAYGLRDVAVIEETHAPTTRHGLHDLLIAMLVAEVGELLHRGLARRYIPMMERLESPRGRILIDDLTRHGGLMEARLPCQHFERSINWHLNQVLRAGLEVAARMTGDHDLRRSVYRVAGAFGDTERKVRLDTRDIDKATRGLSRLTAASAPALRIIRLLSDMLGVAIEPGGAPSRMPGFLFDMNIFFQRLLSRFLRDNLTGSTIQDEAAIRNIFAYAADANPRGRSSPAPRPDFALFHGNALGGFMDAKYRDIWKWGLPADWLYQLSIYALASPTRVSVLLYATMNADACDERIEVRQPVHWSNERPASVILRPVPLIRLAELLDPDRRRTLSTERRQWADELVILQARKSRRLIPGGGARAA
jgi:5-methylcytosine-specific restriction enzyme subunit McrC